MHDRKLQKCFLSIKTFQQTYQLEIFNMKLFQPKDDTNIHEIVFEHIIYFIQCISKEANIQRNVPFKLHSQKMFYIMFNILIVLTSERINL